MNLFAVHGILQCIAFGILFPLGILVALLRNYVGEKWFTFHVGIQLTAVATVFVALIIASIATAYKPKQPSPRPTPTPVHVIVGYVILGLIIFQLVWAMGLRHVIDRPLWYAIHMILASCIIVGGWTNLYLGYMHYKSVSQQQ